MQHLKKIFAAGMARVQININVVVWCWRNGNSKDALSGLFEDPYTLEPSCTDKTRWSLSSVSCSTRISKDITDVFLMLIDKLCGKCSLSEHMENFEWNRDCQSSLDLLWQVISLSLCQHRSFFNSFSPLPCGSGSWPRSTFHKEEST